MLDKQKLFPVLRLDPSRLKRPRLAWRHQTARRYPLLLSLNLPQINPHMTNAIIDIIHGDVDAAIPVGGKLFDLTIDLSAAAPHDCPPVSHYRLVSREQAWLRRLDIAPGDTPETGARLALFSTEPNEALDGPPTRQIRMTIAGIIRQQDWPES